MKKILLIISSLIIFSTAVFSDKIKEVFDINNIDDISVIDNKSYELKKLLNENNKIRYDKAVIEANNHSSKGGDRVAYVKNQIIYRAEPILKKTELEISDIELKKEKDIIKNNALIKSMNIVLLNKNIILQEKIISNLELLLKNAKLKFDKGIITVNELNEKTIAYENGIIKLDELKSNLELLKIELNYIIDKDIDFDIKVEGDLIKIPFNEVNTDELYLNSLNEDKTVLMAKANYDYYKEVFKIYSEKYDEYDDEYKLALADEKIYKFDYEDKKEKLYERVIELVNNYKDSYDLFNLSVLKNELSAKLYNNNKIKYDKGLISKEEFILSEQEKMVSEFEMLEKLFIYNKSKLELENEL